MHSVPEEKGKQNNDERTRIDRLSSDDTANELPPLDEHAQWYLERLFEFGPIASNGFGAIGVSFSEIEAWAHLTAQCLTVTEYRLLHRLSAIYAAAHHEMRKHDALQPYPELTDLEKQDRATNSVESALLLMFGGKRGA